MNGAARGQITTAVGREIEGTHLIPAARNAERMMATHSGNLKTTCFGFEVSRVPESETQDATSRVYG